VLVIDAATEEVCTIACGVDGDNKWQGIAAAGGKLFCAPFNASGVLALGSGATMLSLQAGAAREDVRPASTVAALQPLLPRAGAAFESGGEVLLVREAAKALTAATRKAEALCDALGEEGIEITCREVDLAIRDVRARSDLPAGELIGSAAAPTAAAEKAAAAGAAVASDTTTKITSGAGAGAVVIADLAAESGMLPAGMVLGGDEDANASHSVSAFELAVFHMFMREVDSNPRRIKRLVNTYQLVCAIARLMPLDEDDPAGPKIGEGGHPHSAAFSKFRGKLIKWLVLCECYPYRMSLLVLKLTDVQQMYRTNENVERHTDHARLFRYTTTATATAAAAAVTATSASSSAVQLDATMPIAAAFYEHAGAFVHCGYAGQFLRLDDDAEQLSVVLSAEVPEAGDITVGDILGLAGEGGAAGEDASGRWSLLAFSFNMNPALRDQLSTEISGLQSTTELRRAGPDGAAASTASSLRHKGTIQEQGQRWLPRADSGACDL
jgi:hypothetical protein